MEEKKRMMWTTNIQEIVTKKCFYLPRKHGFGANTKKKKKEKRKTPKLFWFEV